MDITLSTEQIKLVNIIEHYFKSPTDTEAGKLIYTTIEIFQKLQSIYPNEYTPAEVCECLIYLNFETINGGGSKIFWYLQYR